MSKYTLKPHASPGPDRPAFYTQGGEPGSPPPTQTLQRHLQYDGRTEDLFKLYLKNALLILCSLGLYKFWAQVATRKFYYRHTEFREGRFDYHATGSEKFIGFLKGMLVLALPVGLLALLYQVLEPNMPSEDAFLICFYSFFLLFALVRPVIICGARAFNLARSSFNNMHFHFTGKVGDLYKIYLRDILLMIVTLGLYYSWHQVNVRRFTTSHTQIGEEHFNFDGQGGTFFGLVVGGTLLTYFTAGIYAPWMIAGIHRFHVEHTTFQSARFTSSLTGGQVFKLGLLSILAVIFSLGLALPWAVNQFKKLYAETTSYRGSLDLDRLTSHYDNRANAVLEGLGEAGEALEALGDMFGG